MDLTGLFFQQYSGLLKSYAEQADSSIIAIGLNITDFHPRTQVYHPQYYTEAIKTPNVRQALSSIDQSLSWKLRYVPLYSLVLYDSKHYVHILENSANRFSFPTEMKGFEPQQRNGFSDVEKFAYNSIEIYQPFLDNLFDLTVEIKRLGHRPLVFVSPMYFEAYDQIKNLSEFQAIMEGLVKKEIPVITLLYSPISQKKELFYNYLHLNAEGAKLFSVELSHQLNQQINTPEKR